MSQSCTLLDCPSPNQYCAGPCGAEVDLPLEFSKSSKDWGSVGMCPSTRPLHWTNAQKTQRLQRDPFPSCTQDNNPRFLWPANASCGISACYWRVLTNWAIVPPRYPKSWALDNPPLTDGPKGAHVSICPHQLLGPPLPLVSSGSQNPCWPYLRGSTKSSRGASARYESAHRFSRPVPRFFKAPQG